MRFSQPNLPNLCRAVVQGVAVKSEVRPSISATMARDFDEDIDRFARF
jgi:hypothetical protein